MIYTAAEKGYTEIVKYLAEDAACASSASAPQWTRIHTATGRIKEGPNAAFLAAVSHKPDINLVRYLVEHCGADIEAKSEVRFTQYLEVKEKFIDA